MATPSIAENLRHLEMHITDYMHEHAVGTGDILYVQPKGFRFPYKATKETLDENMKYLEMMLEEFLHDHEVAVGGADEEQLVDGSVEDMTTLLDTRDDVFQEVMHNSHESRISFSTANPRTGSQHVRVELDELTGDAYYGPQAAVTNPGTVNDRTFPYTPISSGDEVTVGFWAYVHSSFQTPVFRWRTTAVRVVDGEVTDSAGSGFEELSLATDSYQQVSFTFNYDDLDVGGAFVPNGFFAWSQISTPDGTTVRVDLDDFSIVTPGTNPTLYTNQVGFRFPHPWEEDWAIKENVKHLEDQLSRWLHRHVEGT